MITLNGAASPVIAVDAMGGDHAPDEIVKGAWEATQEGAEVILVGDPHRLGECLDRQGIELAVEAATDIVTMHEDLGTALRKEHSSLARAVDLVTTGEAAAAVSAGNSAAIMGFAFKAWRRLPGIQRPAFGSFLPSHEQPVFVLDMGANPEAKATHLVQFAVMGEVYVRLSRGVELPRIALLSNGTEDSKGTKEIKDAHEALRKLDLNFVGNVEGNQVFDDVADVIVCDGFAGNVLLKSAEGTAMEIFRLLRDEISKDFMTRLGAAAMMPALNRIRKKVDYETYGGAPVLGVNNIMINCHGRSRARAVKNAILLAQRLSREHLTEKIRESLQHEDVEVRHSRLARALHMRHE